MTDVRSIALGDNTVHLVERAGTRLLVDTGPDFAGAWEALREGLRGGLPDVVVATHGHHDHAGLGRQWQGTGTAVWAGASDGSLTARPLLQSPAETAAMLAWAEGTGAPAETLAHVRERIESRRAAALRAAESPEYPEDGVRWPTGLRYPPFEADRLVEGDAEVAGVEILAAPGHTPGNVVLAVREEGWLFSGDQLLPDVDPLPAIQFVAEGEELRRFPTLAHFAASLERLAESGFTRCFPGHGEPFDGAGEALAGALARIERRCARVRESLQQAGPATVYELCTRLYPRGTERRFWQTASSVQGQLDLLASRGEAREADGRWEACQAAS